MVKAIVGANWGDEGKGKITDVMAAKSDIVVRFQGGSNAGHTIINKYGKFSLHQIPSGVFYSHVVNIIGNGVALSVENFEKELNNLKVKGVPVHKIFVSDRAQIVMPYHVLFDKYEEERLSENKFGSTKSGIAPFYSDKCSKIGFQVSELYDDEESLRSKIRNVLTIKNVLLKNLYGKEEINEESVYDKLMEYKKILTPHVMDTFSFLYDAVNEGKNILLEGQLGALKDLDFGIYPMVTSANTTASYGAVGTGIPARKITDVVTVLKAYSSSVGSGEFVSEIFGEDADELRRRGGDCGEYGATTGRPRRMGWLDLVATKFGCRVQGTTEVVLTAVDVLSYLDEIPVCVGYEIDGQEVQEFPVTVNLKKAKPILKVLPGWKCDVQHATKYSDLPENCRKYIEFVEEKIGFPINLVSNGPARESIIYRK